jgi:hypothetical protein
VACKASFGLAVVCPCWGGDLSSGVAAALAAPVLMFSAVAGPSPCRSFLVQNTCQADSCSTDLQTLSFYYQRNHICPVSERGRQLQVGGQGPGS